MTLQVSNLLSNITLCHQNALLYHHRLHCDITILNCANMKLPRDVMLCHDIIMFHIDITMSCCSITLVYIYIKVLSSVSTIVSCDMSEPLLHCDALFFHNNGQFCSGTHCLHIISLSYLRAALWHQIAQILTLLHCTLKAPLWNHKAQYCHGNAAFLPW